MPQYFLPFEANEMLPVIRPLVRQMMDIYDGIRQHQPELLALVEKSAGNGGNATLSKVLPEFDKLDALLHQILKMGIAVKDVTVGLVDFPAVRGDRIVNLCWKYGEENVRYWHERDAGFAERKLIDWE